MFATLEEVLRDRLLTFLVLALRVAFLALVLGLAFLALVMGLALLALVLESAFLALFRLVVVLLAERRRPGFSGFVSGAAAGIAAGLRPRPKPLAS